MRRGRNLLPGCQVQNAYAPQEFPLSLLVMGAPLVRIFSDKLASHKYSSSHSKVLFTAVVCPVQNNKLIARAWKTRSWLCSNFRSGCSHTDKQRQSDGWKGRLAAGSRAVCSAAAAAWGNSSCFKTDMLALISGQNTTAASLLTEDFRPVYVTLHWLKALPHLSRTSTARVRQKSLKREKEISYVN